MIMVVIQSLFFGEYMKTKTTTIVQNNTWIAAIPASNFPAGIQR